MIDETVRFPSDDINEEIAHNQATSKTFQLLYHTAKNKVKSLEENIAMMNVEPSTKEKLLRQDNEDLKKDRDELEVRLHLMYTLMRTEGDRADRAQDRYDRKKIIGDSELVKMNEELAYDLDHRERMYENLKSEVKKFAKGL